MRTLTENVPFTLTITRLAIPPALSKTLFSTNVVESAFSVGRTVMGNVKHWRPRSKTRMIERWCAAGLLVAEKQFRRVKGYKEIPILLAALEAHVGRLSRASDKVA